MVEQRNSLVRCCRGSQSKVPVDVKVGGIAEIEHHEGIGTVTSFRRARWSHQMKLFLIKLLKDHDVPAFRTHNAWSNEAWTNIVCRLNQKFGLSLSVSQVKQKERYLKKDYRSVKDLLAENGFERDNGRNMVDAPADVWASFTAGKNNKDALQWRDKSFPYFDALAGLYDGRHAERRPHCSMDHHASKTKHAPIASSQPAQVTEVYGSPSATIQAPVGSCLSLTLEEENEEVNMGSIQNSSTPMQHKQGAPSSTPMSSEKSDSIHGKEQKNENEGGFHESFLTLKNEEVDRFTATEEKKLDDPYSINKRITAIEGLNGLQMGDLLMAADIFKIKENREVFLSFSTDALRLSWITREIARSQSCSQK